ncbi:hypothetical protein CF386_09140 [Paraphotobacterium marinum]|uniref:Major facilitator superfamily (MFS) profile domain-containing protein n=1 Tax=Paraphotobacterium marinum TaxID=1755811 RepID=A0A220VFT4_9GAMM|nr:MFS transporter [Paraphotobacterium marinum]ASK79225.1 hypothetical protein CF386_09140 [Paraphotobacterium marinum]
MKKNYFKVSFLFLSAWLFIILEYAIRVSDSVILPELSTQFNLIPSDLSLLSSAYYFTYVIFMIPAGMLIDRFGLYKVWILAIWLVSLGGFLFGYSKNIEELIFARALMGLGSNFAIIGTFALSMQFRYKSFLIGLTMAVAMLGAFLGQGPWLHLTTLLGSWRTTYILSSLIGLLLLIMWIFVGRFSQKYHLKVGFSDFKKTVVILLKSPVFIIMALYVGCLSSPQTAFSALWCPTFLQKAYDLTSQDAAYFTSVISLGGLLGGLLLGLIGDAFDKKFQIRLLFISGLIAVMNMLLILSGDISEDVLMLNLFILGFITNASVVVFSFMGSYFNKLPKATIQGTTNQFNMGGGPVFQMLVGYVVTTLSGGVSIEQTSVDHFTKSLSLMPISILMFSILLITLLPIIKARSLTKEQKKILDLHM